MSPPPLPALAPCPRALPGLARAVAAALLALPARRAGAQEPPAPPRRWSGTAQANASVFFGNSAQRVFGGGASVARADSTLELRADVQGLYGDSRAENAPWTVTRRLWRGTTTADYRPHNALSPFVLATVESSYEKRIALRYSGGVGVKRTFVRSERTESSLSVAVLDERTVPRDSGALPDERVTRWSLRGRIRHAFGDRARLSHVTFWQPRATDARRFLVNTTTELRYQATRAVGVTFSFVDSYDSEAVRRGARTYNDGQLLFGMSASW